MAAITKFSVTRAAVMLGVSRTTVIRMIESGEIEASRFNDRGWWRVSRASVEALVAKVTASQEPSK